MPTLTCKLHELHLYEKDIPETEDCYLTSLIHDVDGEEASSDPDNDDSFWLVPWLANDFAPLDAARDYNHFNGEDCDYEKYKNSNGIYRLGCNTYTLQGPFTCTFTWGNPIIKDGMQILKHKTRKDGSYCIACHVEVSSNPTDCPALRLIALATAVREEKEDDISVHLKAVELWHKKKGR